MKNLEEPLSERVAIVTGGGRGLGRAMALGLARVGCRVVITAAREQHEIAAVAEAGGANIHALLADVTARTTAPASSTRRCLISADSTSVTVNAILPGGTTATGMVPKASPSRFAPRYSRRM